MNTGQWNSVHNQLAGSRRFRTLNITNDYSREFIGQLVGTSISGERVAQYLSQLIQCRSKPSSMVCDNGTEFTFKAMFHRKRKGICEWHCTHECPYTRKPVYQTEIFK